MNCTSFIWILIDYMVFIFVYQSITHLVSWYVTFWIIWYIVNTCSSNRLEISRFQKITELNATLLNPMLFIKRFDELFLKITLNLHYREIFCFWFGVSFQIKNSRVEVLQKAALCSHLGIKHIFITPRNPHGNGPIESPNQQIKASILCLNPDSWVSCLPLIEL